MKIRFKRLIYKVLLKLSIGLLFLFRIGRFIRRALKHFISFLPIMIIVVLLIILTYFIGIGLGWYTNGFIEALKDLKTIFISVLLTAYFISFIGTERQRRKDLKSQYAIRYDIVTYSIDFLTCLEYVFNIYLDDLSLNLSIDEDNQDTYLELIIMIKNINHESFKVNWEEEVEYRDKHSKIDYLNCMTKELFEMMKESFNEQFSSNLRDVKREVYEQYQRLRLDFYPINSFDWSRINYKQIREKLLSLLGTIKEMDLVVARPWVVNPKLIMKINYLYTAMFPEE